MARKRYSDEDALKILLIWSLWLTQTDLRPKNAALISHARKIFQTEKLPTGTAIICVIQPFFERDAARIGERRSGGSGAPKTVDCYCWHFYLSSYIQLY